MRVALGAPLGNDREWIWDDWTRCIRKQTLVPSAFCFVLSPEGMQPATTDLPEGAQLYLDATALPFYPRLGPTGRHGDPADPNRARHFSRLRNRLKTLFMTTDADVFVSLDTDVLLQDPTAIERLVRTLEEPGDWACVAGTTYLHPNGAPSGCLNVGWWRSSDQGNPTRVWQRADNNDLLRRPPVPIHIPMAFYAIRRHAMGLCSYSAHEGGEDLGFADSLDRHGLRVAWRPDVQGVHVWGPEYLEEARSSDSVRIGREGPREAA